MVTAKVTGLLGAWSAESREIVNTVMQNSWRVKR